MQGADVNSSKHAANYTALHFASLSGNSEVCLRLLLAGANGHVLNSVNRTPSQMAAFVGNHPAVACINHFIPKSEIEYYCQVHGQQKEAYLPVILLDSFHKFVIQSNIHPVRVALNIQKIGSLDDHLKSVKKVLELMTEKEMKKQGETNEIMAFKYHYLSWIVGEIIKCREHYEKKDASADVNSKSDYVELFAKRVLKENKKGDLEYLETTIRECVCEFPTREATIVRQIVHQLTNEDPLPAYETIRSAIHGQRGFVVNLIK